jgi:hypothetical protein
MIRKEKIKIPNIRRKKLDKVQEPFKMYLLSDSSSSSPRNLNLQLVTQKDD